jgi:hypothetical protein
MKKPKLFASLLLCSVLFFSACTPSFDYITNTNEIITNGSWSVRYFYAGTDKTGTLGNYTFRFNTSGTVECEGSNHTTTGTWQVAKDIEGNDVFHLQLNTQNDELKQLNSDWKVTGKSMVNVALKEEGHGNGQLQINKY